MQHNNISKKLAYELVESAGKKILVLTFNRKKGISKNGKRSSKAKCKRMIDKANQIYLVESDLVLELNLLGVSKFLYRKDNIIKSIFLHKCATEHTYD